METGEEALAALHARANPENALQMAAHHKTPRVYLGLPNAEVDACVAEWRAALDVAGRAALADALWRSDIHEARVAAAKLLIQARIKEDGEVWRLLASWVPELDSWAIADHVASAGDRRVAVDPARLDELERWTASENFWTRRAALTFTMHLAKVRHPKPDEVAHRERVLSWLANCVEDREWFIQTATAWWLRSLSKHDPERVRVFLAEHGAAMKSFARKEAAKHL
ncbi:MAG: DNA alkylation repair protein [Paracoccaceae bacterium]